MEINEEQLPENTNSIDNYSFFCENIQRAVIIIERNRRGICSQYHWGDDTCNKCMYANK